MEQLYYLKSYIILLNPNAVVGKYSKLNGSKTITGHPDYMTTSIADIKFSIMNLEFDPLRQMEGCLCFKEYF